MFAAATSIVAVSVSITVFAGPLYSYAEHAATDLVARSPYISSVLVHGDRGDGQSDEAAGGDES